MVSNVLQKQQNLLSFRFLLARLPPSVRMVLLLKNQKRPSLATLTTYGEGKLGAPPEDQDPATGQPGASALVSTTTATTMMLTPRTASLHLIAVCLHPAGEDPRAPRGIFSQAKIN